jgi:hypothetical protein
MTTCSRFVSNWLVQTTMSQYALYDVALSEEFEYLQPTRDPLSGTLRIKVCALDAAHAVDYVRRRLQGYLDPCARITVVAVP